jgi:acyl-CoA thioesterase I
VVSDSGEFIVHTSQFTVHYVLWDTRFQLQISYELKTGFLLAAAYWLLPAPAPCFYTISVDVLRRVLVSFLLLIVAFPGLAAERPVLVCFGDSITAGYGLQVNQAYPAALQRKLDAAGYHYKVVNEGTSGATTKDAVTNLPALLKLHPQVVIVEFGGNDGLRGLPMDQTRRNLDMVLSGLENAHIKVLLAGITLPPNYGMDYIHTFEGIFQGLAAKHHTAFVPMIYKDLVSVPGTIQGDGIHPTAKGSEIIADTLVRPLKPLLSKAR